jgi:hypothetical protein
MWHLPITIALFTFHVTWPGSLSPYWSNDWCCGPPPRDRQIRKLKLIGASVWEIIPHIAVPHLLQHLLGTFNTRTKNDCAKPKKNNPKKMKKRKKKKAKRRKNKRVKVKQQNYYHLEKANHLPNLTLHTHFRSNLLTVLP